MAASIPTLTRQNSLRLLPAVIKLMGWRFKQMWRFLLITWLGMLAMVVLVCTGPLFALVATSAYLPALLANAADGPYITVETVSTHPTQEQLQQIEQQVNQSLRQGSLAPYLHNASQLVVQTPPFDMLANGKTSPAAFRIDGYDSSQATQHARLLEGRLPQITGDGTVEIALSQDAAANLGLHTGSTFQGRYPIALGSQAWNFRVVGIIAPKVAQDPFWAMGNPFSKATVFLNSRYYIVTEGSPSYNVIAANDAIKPKIAVLQSTAPRDDATNQFVFFWRYPFDLLHLNANDLSDLSQQTSFLDGHLAGVLQNNIPDLTNINIFGTLFTTLNFSSGRIALVQSELINLLLITFALVLFLMGMMSNILIERQAALIATIRSRGATLRHVFGTFAAQGLVLGLAALLVGPLLALLLVRLVVQMLLPTSEQSALTAVMAHPLQAILGVQWYAMIAIALSLFFMQVAINRAAKMNIVSLRHESSRAQRLSFWRRLNLDLFFALLLLAGYAAFVYFWPNITTAGSQIDPNIFVLLSDLGVFVSPLLVAAVLLLFLRFFPLIVRLATTLVARRRGAPAVLALAQMERNPRPAARIIVLLALAIASSSFLFMLIATKDQRVSDTASFVAEQADFSGSLPTSGVAQTLSQLKTYYSKLPGVQSATIGYHDVIQLDTDQSAAGQGSLTVNAVDAETYAQTVAWSSVYSSSPLSALTGQLASHRADGAAHNVVYALVDAAAWQRFHLTQGEQFSLPIDSTGSLHANFIALKQINYVPGLHDSSVLAWSGIGLIVDYQNYTTVKARAMGVAALAPNYLWLKTSDDAAALANIRSILPDANDRRAIQTILQNNPDHLGIIGVLIIGIAAALVLALLGTFIASWFNASNRLTNFAVLRALGMRPHQIAAVLLWEQGFSYLLALLLGAGLSAMLSIFVAPTVSVLTIQHGDIGNGGAPNVPPIGITMPYPQLSLVVGALVVICLAALLLMARLVSRPSISQIIRLNED